jgi:phenylpropionate dioxygenase-like ring-hydroxylating dioxygenase large terminal subunit
MRMSEHPVFRKFWYPTLSVADLANGPKPFTLLGEELVLWLQSDGAPAALADRCPHRRARLSVDSRIIDGNLQCGYHGWRFSGGGRCVLVPQMSELTPSQTHDARRFLCQERYGFVWVCLAEEPHLDIPFIRHSDDPNYRQVFEYAEDWNANAMVVCENALDLGHVSFVHRDTFGNDQKPVAPRLTLVPLDHGVNFKCTLPVANHELQQKNLQIPDSETVRTVDIRWLMPSTFILHFTYPNGLVHEICGFATPIDDGRIRRIQFAYRNDTESDAPAEQVARFDRSVGAEDRRVLESCEDNFVLSPVLLAHMMLDAPGLVMRRILSELISQHDPNAHLIAAELAGAALPELEGAA